MLESIFTNTEHMHNKWAYDWDNHPPTAKAANI